MTERCNVGGGRHLMTVWLYDRQTWACENCGQVGAPVPEPTPSVRDFERWGRIEGVTLQREEIEGAPI